MLIGTLKLPLLYLIRHPMINVACHSAAIRIFDGVLKPFSGRLKFQIRTLRIPITESGANPQLTNQALTPCRLSEERALFWGRFT